MARWIPPFRPPGRRKTTTYPWGGIQEGAAGVITRTWTAKGQRVLHLACDPEFPMIRHNEVASIHPPDSPFFEGPGRLDQSNFAYHLVNGFRKLRHSVFDVYVQVSATFVDAEGVEVRSTARVRTRAEFPLWIKATDAMRYNFYGAGRKRGSRGVDFDDMGRRRFARRRREAPSVERSYESPPDLFWLSAYACWYAMEKATSDLQDRGRSYLDRLTFIQYNIDDLAVVQREIVEEDE